MQSRESLIKMAESLLKDPSHFVVDVVLSTKPGSKRVLVLVDGDQGISIDDCAELSRAMSTQLDEDDTWEDAYTLEVSTPGLDQPLKLKRQYVKNRGREVKVMTKDKQWIAGKLAEVSEDSITLLRSMTNEKKQKEEQTVTINFDQLEKTLVQVSFK
jgi:ribosome maturation factor RimP